MILFIILPGDTDSLASIQTTTSLISSGSALHAEPSRHSIDQLAINMGFGGIRPTLVNPSTVSTTTTSSLSTTTTANSTSLTNSANPVFQPVSTPSLSEHTFDLTDNISLNREVSNESEDGVKERIITKIDPVEMVAKPAVVTVPKDIVQRSAMLLSGPKFQLNTNEIPKEKITINTDTICPVAVSLIIILIIKNMII